MRTRASGGGSRSLGRRIKTDQEHRQTMPGQDLPQGIETIQAINGTDLDTIPAFAIADPDRIDLGHDPPQSELGLERIGSAPVAEGSDLDQVVPRMDNGMPSMIRARTAFLFRQNDLKMPFELRIEGKGFFGARHGRRGGLGMHTNHAG